MKERYGVQDPKAQHFRFGVVCGGSSLVAPQPYNNVVRVAVETMAAVLGGAQSIFTCAFDEAFQIPTEFSAELAVRTQQIIAYESGIGAHRRSAGRQLLRRAAHRPHGRDDQQGDGRDRRLRRRRPGDRGRLDPDAAGRARRSSASSRSTPARRSIVGQNHFRSDDEQIGVGEVFKLDPTVAKRALEKFERVLDTRSQAAVDASLAQACRRRGARTART